MNEVIKRIFKSGINAATLAFTTSKLTKIIMSIFTLSVGGIIAFIVDVVLKQ